VIWQEKVGYANGAKGRTGERVTIGPGDAAKLGDRMLESDNWNVK
jgi:hypothetical protein